MVKYKASLVFNQYGIRGSVGGDVSVLRLLKKDNLPRRIPPIHPAIEFCGKAGRLPTHD